MQVHAHPQLPGTHVVLDVRECPKMFRMLSELTCGSEALEYDAAISGFVMTLEVYRTLRTRLTGATSLLDLMGILPPRRPPSHENNTKKYAPTITEAVSTSSRSIHTQTTASTETTTNITTQSEETIAPPSATLFLPPSPKKQPLVPQPPC